MAAIAIELDNETKNALEEILPKMGLDFNSFFAVYAAKVIRDRRIPFHIEAPEAKENGGSAHE